MKIEILGSGCANCRCLEENARKAVAELGVKAKVIKITDIEKIMDYCIMSTPAIAVDGKIMSYGRICDVSEIKKWLVR